MRIPSRCFTRRAQHLFLANSTRASLTRQTVQYAPPLLTISGCLSSRSQACHGSSLATPSLAKNTTSRAATPLEELLSPLATTASRRVKRTHDPPTWVDRLNKQLPEEFRISQNSSFPPDNRPARLLRATKLEKVFIEAKSERDTELLLWLVENGYRRTAVWLMKSILDLSRLNRSTAALNPPSNVHWPDNLFTSIEKSPVHCPLTFHPVTNAIHDESLFETPHFETRAARSEARLLARVWETLGILIVDSNPAGADDSMDDSMLTALLVLAHVHNLDMVPENVYSYTHQDRSTHSQRPPILNLVSSRILAALSDVTWRQQQDDAISQATRMGKSLNEISKTVPGGRFRLKVRPLAPEIWLELILWCCIESGHIASALAIVAKLAAQTGEPWFAIRWTSPQSREKLSTLIDWDRVELRHGGPAGLIEGYSREKPFVDVPDKTISVEVVLALVEKLLASVVSSSLTNTSKAGVNIIHKDFRPLRWIMDDIQNVMTFLEPHDLAPGYFDYLESRLLQDGAFDLPRAPVDLYTWTTQMKAIRELERINPEQSMEQNLQLHGIQAQSQLHVGFQQQALNTLVEFGDVHHTLAVFNEIQESVDENKVASIKQFLQHQQSATTKATPISYSKHDLEFTNCHGQLPYYRLAGLLNLISDTNLIGLGRWLLYAQDVDGAALPEQVWGLRCLIPALYRFAAVSQDEDLLETLKLKMPLKPLPSVKTLRTLADTEVSFLRLYHARSRLDSLRNVSGGGFGLSNVVNIAAMILRLEQRKPEDVERSLRMTVLLLEDMLVKMRYTSLRSDFTLEVRQLFKRQIHHILFVFFSFRGSVLERFAQKHAAKYPYSNLALLPAKYFNVLLSASIDAYGAEFGKLLWQKLCKIPDSPYAIELLDIDVKGLQDLVAADEYDDSDVLNETNAASGHEHSDLSSESKVPKSYGLSSTGISANDRQHDQYSHDEELIPFDDPFFPETPPRSVKDSQAMPERKENDAHASSKTDHRRMAKSDIRSALPIFVPDLNGLRLIIRAAVREMKSRQEAALPTLMQMRQLAWAVQMFKAFGVTDHNAVEQEIQFPLDELDAGLLKESEKAMDHDKELAARLAVDQDLRAGTPASDMWLPVTTSKSVDNLFRHD